jgi:hypothetical protein
VSLHAHPIGLRPRGARTRGLPAHPGRGVSADVPWARLRSVRVGIVLWGGLALLDLGRLAAAPEYAGLGAVAVLVTAACVRADATTGLAAALVGWLLVDGFVEHRYGALGFDAAHDLAVLALLTGLALSATRIRR